MNNPIYLNRNSPYNQQLQHYGYDRETAEEDKWRLDVGAECNRLLGYAEALEVGSLGFGESAELAKTIRSIVRRVVEFEDLEVEDGN